MGLRNIKIGLLALVGLLTLSWTGSAQAATSCDSWTYDGRAYRTCYKDDGKVTWFEARTFCRGLGSGWDLIDINGQAEHDETVTHIDNTRLSDNGSSGLGPWIGTNDLATEGVWVNLRAQPLCYENWSVGEPNNLFGEDCAHLFAPGNITQDANRWNDFSCDGQTGTATNRIINSFFCELESPLDPTCGCTLDTHCAEELPICRVVTGQCVECLDNDDCAGATPVCDTTTNRCVPNPTDTDDDGQNDSEDLDDDNDGIPDLIEGDGDLDGDDIPNSLDLDSDGDGIPDVDEAGGMDADNDGRIDNFMDSNNDGLHDPLLATPLPTPNTDGDGGLDFLDRDADGDGITDVVEAGGTDADGDGVPDVSDADQNEDGWVDAIEGSNSFGPTNSDNQGLPDFQSLDSDGDGISDAIEGHDVDADGVADVLPLGNDRDDDGIDDAFDPDCTVAMCGQVGVPAPTPNHDGDTLPDFQDPDDDNDGPDSRAECPLGPPGCPDTDADGRPDYLDPDSMPGGDSDMDGLPDSVECPGNPTPDATCPDSDNDDVPDYLDVDDDNDGILTRDELSEGPDSDDDGVPNHLDLDSDNDGIVDIWENGNSALDANKDGQPDSTVDVDMDGLLGAFDPNDNDADSFDVTPLNTDGTGPADYLDLDSDDDGITDIIEALGSDGNSDGRIDAPRDSNGNGLADAVDPSEGGSPWEVPDTDGDRSFDFQDTDSDNDDAPDAVEGHDSDADGLPDVAPRGADGNNNGIDDAYENTPAPLPDYDDDGEKDYRDDDDDDDGIPTADENPDPNGDGLTDDAEDADGNGFPDYLDAGDRQGPTPDPGGSPGLSGGSPCAAQPGQSNHPGLGLLLLLGAALLRRRR